MNDRYKTKKQLISELIESRKVIAKLKQSLAMLQNAADTKQEQRVLQEGQQNFRAVFESPHAVMLIIDPETGKIEDGNPGACIFYGYSRTELKQQDVFDVNTLPPEIVRERMQRAKLGQCRYFDFQHRLASGEVRDVEVCNGPIAIDGKPFIISMINDVTARKQSETALRKSEERYRKLFDTAPIAILEEDFSKVQLRFNQLRSSGVKDFKSYFDDHPEEVAFCTSLVKKLEANQETATLLQAPSKEDIPQDLTPYFKQGSWTTVRDALVTLADGKGRFEGEVAFSTLKGVDKIVAFRLSVSERREKMGLKVLLSLIDITERERAKQQLEKSVSLLRSTLEATKDGILVINKDKKVVAFNQRLLDMWHVPADLAVPRAREAMAFALTHLKDPDKFVKHISPFMECDESDGFQVLQFQDGRIFECDSLPQRIGDQVVGRVFSFKDVTDQKRSEEALRESEQRNSLLIEESPVGIALVQDGKITYANPTALSMFTYTPSCEVLGRRIGDFLAPGEHQRIDGLIQDRWAGRRLPKSLDVRGVNKKGEILDLVVWPRAINQVGPVTTLLFIADRTEANSMWRQLLHAQKMEAIGTLAGGIAHDLNNLLTVILGYSELMLSGEGEKDTRREDLTKIIDAARTAGEIVQQILAFGRKTEITLKPLNLNRQVDRLRKMLSRLIPKTIEIQIKLDPDLPSIRADQAQMDQILMNLVVNARDAMPDGGCLTIETRLAHLDENHCRSHVGAVTGPHALLMVSDTGTGIDRASMDRIFEPFYTTKAQGEGTGLGLAMVYSIVKSHGGHISCNSKPGRGATFRIYLPLHKTEEKAEVVASQGPSATGTGTILLVEDEEVIRDLTKRMLERVGYRVITASNGYEAIEAYKTKGERVSLVVLDLIMPIMDGKQCFKEILKIDPKAKIVITSGYSADRVPDEIIRSGKGFVRKPLNVTEFLKTVQKVLNDL